MADASRPILITIVAILEFLVGLLAVIGGILLFAGVISSGDLDPEIANLGNAGAIGVLIFGIINLIIAGGFWNGWAIMWYIGLIVNAIGAAFYIFSLVTTLQIILVIPVIIEVVIIYYLFRPKVKEFFGI